MSALILSEIKSTETYVNVF